jgi:AcrR family transcriptional regulator
MIVDAAVRLIEDRGTDGFSMRSLATELDVYPTALYWHVGDRSQVLGLVERRWMEDLEVPEPGDDWREWARELARRYRRAALRHPHIARLVTVTRARSMETMEIPDAIVGMLAGLGLDEDGILHTYNALMGAVRGFVVLELTLTVDGDSDSNASLEAELAALDAERFPNLVAHHATLANRALSMRWSDAEAAAMDESFEHLLTLLITGIEAQLPGRSRRTGGTTRR